MRGLSRSHGRSSVAEMESVVEDFDYDSSEFAVLVLVDEDDDAQRTASLLHDARSASQRDEVVIATPPRRGIEFFADPAVQEDLDRWWGVTVPRDAVPLYIANHHESLVDWVDAVDGHFFVSIPSPDLEHLYAVRDNVTTVVTSGDPHDLVAVVAPRCGLPAPLRQQSRDKKRDRPNRFQRARLETAEELEPIARAVEPPIPDYVAPKGSEAFFSPLSVPRPAAVADSRSHLADELIEVLAEAIRGLQRMRPATREADPV